jgi:hypothetical protein
VIDAFRRHGRVLSCGMKLGMTTPRSQMPEAADAAKPIDIEALIG